MTSRERNAAILIGVILLLVSIVAFVAGRSCASPAPAPLHPEGIDAGPGEQEIAARLDASLREAEERLAQIERKFDEDIAAFDRQQQEEYDRLLEGGDVDDIAEFLRDWNTRRMRPER